MHNKWSDEDIALMNSMIANKKSFSQIAKATKRTLYAVKYKYGRLYRKKLRSKIEIHSEYSDTPSNSDEEYDNKIYNQNSNTSEDETSDSKYISLILKIYTSFGCAAVVAGMCRYVYILFHSLKQAS